MTTKRTDNTLDLPKPPERTTDVLERETRMSHTVGSALTVLGRSLQGLDGKRYLGSFAVHVYAAGGPVDAPNFVGISHATDLQEIPEAVALQQLKELSRSVMLRYGRKPPKKRNEPVDPGA